ncbi:MAG: 50S ribosomal protein L30e [Candidatus Bilamarchaeum sp.]|jgi:large subunit ribosomal protein L30e
MVEEKEEVQEESIEETDSPTQEVETKQKKQKKVVRRRKSKKDKESEIVSAIRLAVESGKVDFGYKTATSANSPKAKLFVVAANTPSEIRSKIEGSSKSNNTPIIEFDGTSVELGSVCGLPYTVSVLAVYDAGTSNIMEMTKKK